MITAAELAQARADAEREMPDRITIKRITGSTLDPATLVETPTYTTVYSALPASIMRIRDDRSVTQGGETISMTTYAVHVPAATTDIEDGDLIEITSTTDGFAPTLNIENCNAGTATITRRLTCRVTGVGDHKGDWPEPTS